MGRAYYCQLIACVVWFTFFCPFCSFLKMVQLLIKCCIRWYSVKFFTTYHRKKQVSMIRKCHNHTPQTIPRHRKEEPQNSDCHKTSGRQVKQSNQVSLPHQNDCKIRRYKVLNNKTRTKHRTTTNNGNNNKL